MYGGSYDTFWCVTLHFAEKAILKTMREWKHAIVGWTVIVLTGMASAQSTRSFAVASIRANRSGERIMLFNPARGGRFTATNSSLHLLIRYAYDVADYQISGAPDWVKSDHWDIAAKGEGDPPVSEIREMLQRLIEDRFQLKYHADTKDVVEYHLVVSSAGKLKRAEPGDCPSILSGSLPSQPDDAPCGTLRNSAGNTKGYKLTAGELAGSLSMFLGRSVVDKTGLTGRYDIELRWTPESAQMQPGGVAEGGPPSIFTALREQLGLKLESAKGSVKTLVIDHVERPSEN
jgi:uncharacterized protein (TIGR03435 family)